jgi:hypothetical protein
VLLDIIEYASAGAYSSLGLIEVKYRNNNNHWWNSNRDIDGGGDSDNM